LSRASITRISAGLEVTDRVLYPLRRVLDGDFTRDATSVAISPSVSSLTNRVVHGPGLWPSFAATPTSTSLVYADDIAFAASSSRGGLMHAAVGRVRSQIGAACLDALISLADDTSAVEKRTSSHALPQMPLRRWIEQNLGRRDVDIFADGDSHRSAVSKRAARLSHRRHMK